MLLWYLMDTNTVTIYIEDNSPENKFYNKVINSLIMRLLIDKTL